MCEYANKKKSGGRAHLGVVDDYRYLLHIVGVDDDAQQHPRQEYTDHAERDTHGYPHPEANGEAHVLCHRNPIRRERGEGRRDTTILLQIKRSTPCPRLGYHDQHVDNGTDHLHISPLFPRQTLDSFSQRGSTGSAQVSLSHGTRHTFWCRGLDNNHQHSRIASVDAEKSQSNKLPLLLSSSCFKRTKNGRIRQESNHCSFRPSRLSFAIRQTTEAGRFTCVYTQTLNISNEEERSPNMNAKRATLQTHLIFGHVSCSL